MAIDGTVIVKQPDADDPANPYGIWLEPTGDNGAPKLTMTTTPWRVIRIVKHGLNPDGTVSCSAVVSIGASGVAGKALKLVTVTEAPTAATRTVRENYMLPTPRIEETPNWGLLSTGIAAVVKLGDSPISPS